MRIVNAKSSVVATGAIVTIGMQTSPDEAVSNLAGWLRMIGIDRVPSAFSAPSVDAVGTLLGVVLMLVGVWMFWRDRTKRSELHEEQQVLADCTGPDGIVDRDRLRAEMDRITDPDREFHEAFDEFAKKRGQDQR